MPFRGILALISFCLMTNLSAQSLEISLSNKSAKFAYGTLIGASTAGRTEFNTGILYNDDHNFLFDIGLLVIDAAGSKSPGLKVGVGPKFYYANVETGNVAAIGLGGELRYKFPSLNRLLIYALGYYAPKIVTFADADQMYEYSINIGYELLPTADAFIGYRNVQADFGDRGKEDIDKSAHFGLRFRF